jgi:spoIIIJ-associated protein
LDTGQAAGELKLFLDEAMRATQFALEWEISIDTSAAQDGQGSIVVAFRGEDEPLLLERNAELLLALEYIAHRWLKLDPRLHDRVRFDCGAYRAERLDELKLSARVAAQRVRETGEAFRFNPMSSRERRLIHVELAGAAGVRTMSEGSGDRRQLVIYPTSPVRSSGKK